jgi:hypothetical protein
LPKRCTLRGRCIGHFFQSLHKKLSQRDFLELGINS